MPAMHSTTFHGPFHGAAPASSRRPLPPALPLCAFPRYNVHYLLNSPGDATKWAPRLHAHGGCGHRAAPQPCKALGTSQAPIQTTDVDSSIQKMLSEVAPQSMAGIAQGPHQRGLFASSAAAKDAVVMTVPKKFSLIVDYDNGATGNGTEGLKTWIYARLQSWRRDAA